MRFPLADRATVSAPAPQVDPNPATWLERRIAEDIFDRVNAEREARGVAPMAFDRELATYAAEWSREMAATGYRHSNLGDVPARHPQFIGVGENINVGFGNQTAGRLHVEWMESDGHRENLLRRSWNAVGIGIHCDGSAIWGTQVFAHHRTESPPDFTEVDTSPEPVVRPEVLTIGCTGHTSGFPPHRSVHDHDALVWEFPWVSQFKRQAERLSGATRVSTAVAVAEHGWPHGAPVALLAAAWNFPDALAGPDRFATAAAVATYPVDGEPASNSMAVVASGANWPDALVASAVVDDLEELGLIVQRVAGDTRTSTAVAIAEYAENRFGMGWQLEGAAVVTGAGFADALAVAPLAGRERTPILLTARTTQLGLDAERFLRGAACTIETVRVVGGPAAVSVTAAYYTEQASTCLDPDA